MIHRTCKQFQGLNGCQLQFSGVHTTWLPVFLPHATQCFIRIKSGRWTNYKNTCKNLTSCQLAWWFVLRFLKTVGGLSVLLRDIRDRVLSCWAPLSGLHVKYSLWFSVVVSNLSRYLETEVASLQASLIFVLKFSTEVGDCQWDAELALICSPLATFSWRLFFVRF